jgi:hypothetical protein
VGVAACLALAAATPNVLLASPAAPPDSPRAAAAWDSANVSSAAIAPDSARTPAPPPPPPAYLTVETRPSGLRVTIRGVDAGSSPLGPVTIPSGRVTVRAFPRDSLRFDPAVDGVTLDAAPGETVRVMLDLRPHPLLRSRPESAVSLLNVRESGRDSVLGETPLRLAPSVLEGHDFRFDAHGFADSVVAGAWLLDAAGGGTGSVTLTLRSLNLPPPLPPPGPSIFGRRWLQWGLVGVGALLTGGAAVLRHERDRAYDRYLQASDPRVIEREYDRTVRYDRWSAATLGTGQVMFTAGLFLLISGLGR